MTIKKAGSSAGSADIRKSARDDHRNILARTYRWWLLGSYIDRSRSDTGTLVSGNHILRRVINCNCWLGNI